MHPAAVALRVLWCAIAGTTLAVALRVWWPIQCAAWIAARSEDERVRIWSDGIARALGGMVVVAACNLLAGLYSVALPTRPDADEPPRSMVDWAPVVIPLLFIASAIVKLLIVLGVWRSYRAVVQGAPRRRASHSRPPAGGSVPY